MNSVQQGPAYLQLHAILRSLIQNGDYVEGEKFITEREISRQYDVSRVTVSKAVSRLVSEGVLEIRKGAGTFIRRSVLNYDLRHLVSFTEKAISQGLRPRTKVLSFHQLAAAKASRQIREDLQIADGTDKLTFVERLRLADETPVIYERRWIVTGLCAQLTKSDAKGSLYSAWTDKFDLDIEGADEVIRAINLSSKQAELLDVLPQTAGLLVRSTGFIAGAIPLWWEETLYRNDAYEFRNRLAGLPSSGPAIGQITSSH